MSEKAPAFQWYPKDCDTDENVKAMDDREFGFYIRLLNHSWLNNGIPADLKRLSIIMGRTHGYVLKIWPSIACCFYQDGERLFNKKQELSREKSKEFSEIKSAAAMTRWDNTKKTQDRSDARACAVQCSPSPSPSASATAYAEHTHIPRALAAPRAADLNGHTSQRFEEFWDAYPRKQHKEFSCSQWVSIVSTETEGAVFACLSRYLASDEVARGVVQNPDKWLYEQHRNGWAGSWPGRPVMAERKRPLTATEQAKEMIRNGIRKI